MTTPTVQSAYAGLPAVQYIPTNLLQKGVLSDTSSAPDCFINQRLSAKLQAYLVSYVNAVAGDRPISGV